MNHVHGLHALASPTCAAIMADTNPACVRLRIMADQVNARVECGDILSALELRALVFALHDVADKMDMPVPMRRSRRGWWWRIFG